MERRSFSSLGWQPVQEKEIVFPTRNRFTIIFKIYSNSQIIKKRDLWRVMTAFVPKGCGVFKKKKLLKRVNC